MLLLLRYQKRFRSSFLHVYPYAYAFVTVVTWIYRIRFLFELSPYWSPWMQLLGGQSYVRITQQDYQRYERRLNRERANAGPWVRLGLATREFIKLAVPSAILFLKFMEWWYTSGRARTQKEDDLMERDAIPSPDSLPVRVLSSLVSLNSHMYISTYR